MLNPSFSLPVFILALLVAILGLWRKDFRFLIVAAVLSLPLSFYLQGNSDLGLLVWAIPLTLSISAYSLKVEKVRLAWVMFLPSVLLFLMLAIALFAWLGMRG